MGIEEFLASGNERLDMQLKFTAEIDKMTSIYRRTLLISGERRENDAEHSWHIAVMALLFKEYCVEEPDAKYAACLDRLQPFLHNTLTEGYTWREGHTHREQVEKRMKIIKDFMPAVYEWVDKNLDRGIEKGWLNS